MARFEHGKVEPSEVTMTAIRGALATAGVEFLADDAVRFQAVSRGPMVYRVVCLPRGTYGVELVRPDGTTAIVQRLRTRQDALTWIGRPNDGC